MPVEETLVTRPSGGRVRSKDARETVLAATTELVEELGYQGVTFERVAARAGVARSTVYRWWKSKAPLVMEAFRASVEQRLPEPDTGSVAADLAAFATAVYGVSAHPAGMRMLRGLTAEAQLDPAFAETFQTWVRARRAVVLAALARGVDRGELRSDTDLDAAADHVFGLFWYRLLVDHEPLDPARAPAHVAQLLRGLTAVAQSPQRRGLGQGPGTGRPRVG